MEEADQITANPPTTAPTKIKNPKRVAAGKALALSNKLAKEAQKRELMRESESCKEVDVEKGRFESLTILAVIGTGATLFGTYFAYKKYVDGNKRVATVSTTQPAAPAKPTALDME